MAGMDDVRSVAAHELAGRQSRLGSLRQLAGKTVGSAFYGTVFQMIRKSPFKTEIGHGGRGEEVFAAQLHGLFAERMGEARGHNLGDVLYRRLERQQQRIDRTRIGGAG
jgi:hypothetical protein